MQDSEKVKPIGRKNPCFTKNMKKRIQMFSLKMIFISMIIMVFMTNLLFSQTETIQTELDEKTIFVLSEISSGSDKVITVTPVENGYRAKVQVYEKIEDEWKLVFHTDGFVGRNGVTSDKKEGDGATPFGIYTFGRAFGVADDPGSILTYTKVTENDVWVDDVKSRFYNQWSFKDNPDADWDSAEHLMEYPLQYKYVLTINYNTDPIISGKGSAIFLHCSADRPTAGCVSVPETAMLFLLGFIDEETIIGIFYE